MVSLESSLEEGEEGLTLADTVADVEDFTLRVLEAVSARVPVERLSPAGRWTLHEVAHPIAAGSAVEDVARRLQKSRRHVNRHLEELRQELLGLGEAA